MGASRHRLHRMQGRRTGWPVGTIAVYGPNDKLASKLVAAVVTQQGAEPSAMKTWFSESGDVRRAEAIMDEVVAFFEAHSVRRAITADRVLGCPHQRGIDYEGTWCPNPQCSFWVGIDRWTGETEH